MTRLFSHEPMSWRSVPPGVRALLVANAAVFVLSAIIGPIFNLYLGLVPRLVLEQRWFWQIATYMFVHGGFFHLFFNMFMLWMFGMPVESQWGTKEFLKFYFICGLAVAAVKTVFWPHSMTPLIGASGAIFGLLVAFAMLYPEAVVYLYFFIPIKAAHMAVLCGLMELLLLIGQGDRGVDHFAHLTGIAAGYVYIRWWWAIRIRLKSRAYDLLSRAAVRRVKRADRGAPPPPAGMEDVDRILDKILAQGLNSLTEEEREIMRRYSDRMKH